MVGCYKIFPSSTGGWWLGNEERPICLGKSVQELVDKVLEATSGLHLLVYFNITPK